MMSVSITIYALGNHHAYPSAMIVLGALSAFPFIPPRLPQPHPHFPYLTAPCSQFHNSRAVFIKPSSSPPLQEACTSGPVDANDREAMLSLTKTFIGI